MGEGGGGGCALVQELQHIVIISKEDECGFPVGALFLFYSFSSQISISKYRSKYENGFRIFSKMLPGAIQPSHI